MKKSKNKPYIVIDSNIIISAAILPNSVSAEVLRVAIKKYTVCASEATFAELAEVIQRKRFDKYFSSSEYTRLEFLSNFHMLCYFFEPSETIKDCIDQKDNKFLEIAIAANAEILISGDKKHLLSMNPYRGIQIITAREFLTMNK